MRALGGSCNESTMKIMSTLPNANSVTEGLPGCFFTCDSQNGKLLLQGFPDDWKEAHLSPRLKKENLDLVFENYHSVSNLPFLSKITERAAICQVHSFTTAHDLYPPAQSAYRKYHSPETALLKVKNDILLNMNKQHVTLLVLLDVSAAFDTVDHAALRLHRRLGISGAALVWFSSYLAGRSQRISINGTLSDRFILDCGISTRFLPWTSVIHYLYQ